MYGHLDYCGEIHPIVADSPLRIGRDAELTTDNNPYRDRRFLEIREQDSLTWLINLGTQLAATVSDADGGLQAWLAPGSRVPLVFARTSVWFTAGPTTYEFEIVLDQAPYVPTQLEPEVAGATTVGRVAFTPDQQLLILSLAHDVLRRGNRGAGTIPSSADAAARLGWTITKFNRKLDNVCHKLARLGVRGLHGDAERMATGRRARLVEYAVAAHLVTPADLDLLDAVAVERVG